MINPLGLGSVSDGCLFGTLKSHISRVMAISFWMILCSSQAIFAEVGDLCPQGNECPPGEICAPGRLAEDPAFCTRSCTSERPCPEEYLCEPRGGISLCNTPIEYAELGESCEPSCGEGLLCLDDGSEQYCSAACTLPGSCPRGFSCRPGALNACAKITTAPSIGEPCDDETGCSGDYECLNLPNRELRYCTYGCAEIRCPSFMACEGEGEEARCVHFPYTRSLGDECVSEAFDSSTIGCEGGYTCERDGDRRRCTQDCSVENPCPDGFGCVDRPETPNLNIGRCIPGVDDNPGLAPFENGGGYRGDEEYAGSLIPQAGTDSANGTGNQSATMMGAEEDSGCSSSNRLDTTLWWMIALVLSAFSLRSLSKGERL